MSDYEQTSLRVDATDLAIAETIALEEGGSRSEVLRRAIKRGLAAMCEERNTAYVFLTTQTKRRSLLSQVRSGEITGNPALDEE